MRLSEIATVIRSKNAGPFVLTFDILFEDADTLERVRASGDLTIDSVAAAFAISPNAVRDFSYYPFASAVKFSIQRTRPSGSRSDSDVYGAQQYSPLLNLEIGTPGAARKQESADVQPHLIARDFDRSHLELLEKIKPKVSVLAIGAPMAFGPRFVADRSIRPIRDDMKVFGPAFTVLVDEPDSLMPSYATTLAKPGDVLVIAAGGRLDISVWGNSMSFSAMNRKLGGVVIDGTVNDTAMLRAATEYTAGEEARRGGVLPVFARGSSASFAGWGRPGSINVPVSFAGRIVEPGDLVVGDVDGLAIVPRRFIPEIEARISRLAGMARELDWTTRIREGEVWFDILSLDKQIASLAIPEIAMAPVSEE